MKKPRVFLSHSKKDRTFIEQLAGDLRASQVDVWYDEWEIPPGDSLRARIFGEGIVDSELFFAYLTIHSVDSFWCQRELDAAFVREVDNRGGTMALFVDSDDTRGRLAPDLRATSVPTLNAGEYERPLRLLLSKAWAALTRTEIRNAENRLRMQILELEKQVADRELQFERLRATGVISVPELVRSLQAKTFDTAEAKPNLSAILRHIGNAIAAGATSAHLSYLTRRRFGFPPERWPADDTACYRMSDVLGPLIIDRIVEVRPPSGDWDELYYLSDLGKAVLRAIGQDAL